MKKTKLAITPISGFSYSYSSLGKHLFKLNFYCNYGVLKYKITENTLKVYYDDNSQLVRTYTNEPSGYA